MVLILIPFQDLSKGSWEEIWNYGAGKFNLLWFGRKRILLSYATYFINIHKTYLKPTTQNLLGCYLHFGDSPFESSFAKKISAWTFQCLRSNSLRRQQHTFLYYRTGTTIYFFLIQGLKESLPVIIFCSHLGVLKGHANFCQGSVQFLAT